MSSTLFAQTFDTTNTQQHLWMVNLDTEYTNMPSLKKCFGFVLVVCLSALSLFSSDRFALSSIKSRTFQSSRGSSPKKDSTISLQTVNLTTTPRISTHRQQRQALSSLEYWVDGEWNKREKIVDPSLDNVWKQLPLDRNLSVSPDGLDLLYFRPLRLQPIALVTLEEALAEADQARQQQLQISDSSTASNSSSPAESFSQEIDPKESIPLLRKLRYHRLTSTEALQCLHNKRVFFLGDSHMRNVWRAFYDVLIGETPNDYRRFDGYTHRDAQFPSLLPKTYVPGFFPFPMNLIGVPGACTPIPNAPLPSKRRRNTTSYSTFEKCRNDAVSPHLFDGRSLDCDLCQEHNITVRFSGCAASMRNLLDASETREPCKMSSLPPEPRPLPGVSQWESMLQLQRNDTRQQYDIWVLGFHTHDIKAATCGENWKSLSAEEQSECRYQRGKEMLVNADRIAKTAAKHNISIVWLPVNSEDLDDIPAEYRAFQQTLDVFRERRALAGIFRQHGHVVLDGFHLSLASRHKQAQDSTWPSAHSNGSHDARFLSRMKIQVLLNHLCPREAAAEEEM